MIFKKKNKTSPKTAETAAKKSPVTKKKARKKRDPKKQSLLGKLFYLVVYFGLALFLIGCFGVWLYSAELTKRYKLDQGALDGVLWQLPSRVYARPLELYEDKSLRMEQLVTELNDLDYVSSAAVAEPGSYHVQGNEVLIYKQAFAFWDTKEPEQLIRLTIKNDKITKLIDMNTLAEVPIVRLEPILIGSIYPKHGEDRVLIGLDNTPDVLVDTIIATEDRRFYSHAGIDPKGLARAVFQGLKAGGIRQGASTLTQQFVKNHYLTRERKISRKVKEAIISVILEKNYSKQQILEGYLNEIFLGQDGDRAIHGFGLAAEYYFGQSLEDLGLHQIATLVALVREPGRANPYKYPKYATERRQLILNVMVGQGLIAQEEADLAASLPLDVLPESERVQKGRYYSFMQFVQKQLGQEYDSDKLATGLNVFTTLDPMVQNEAERSIADALNVLEKRNGLKKDFLQSASVIVNTNTAEVVAIVGDRDASRKGFNRAIQAKRQPGSLLKPVVYLSALEYPQRYNLATMVDDSPLIYKSGGGEIWKPKNYSKRNKGEVMLIDGLVNSYNIPTARIALDIGVNDVVGRLEDLGARSGLPEYPSIALGAVAMTPMEVAQIYESLANGGYRMPLRAITSITDAYDKPINRYAMESVKVISDEPYFLIIKAMQETVKRGTAKNLKQKISSKLNIAGKTGTTDDYRDSWFAGFSGNYLNVVWVGNDDNEKTGLSGNNGAMRVWMDVMKDLPLKPLNIRQPNSVFEFEVDLSNGQLMTDNCRVYRKSTNLPFIGGSEPVQHTNCYRPKPIDKEGIEFESFDEVDISTSNGNGFNNDVWYNQSSSGGVSKPTPKPSTQTVLEERRSRGGFND